MRLGMLNASVFSAWPASILALILAQSRDGAGQTIGDCYWKLFTEALVSHEMYENTFTAEGTSSMKDSAFNHCQINLGLGHSVSD